MPVKLPNEEPEDEPQELGELEYAPRTAPTTEELVNDLLGPKEEQPEQQRASLGFIEIQKEVVQKTINSLMPEIKILTESKLARKFKSHIALWAQLADIIPKAENCPEVGLIYEQIIKQLKVLGDLRAELTDQIYQTDFHAAAEQYLNSFENYFLLVQNYMGDVN